MATQNFFALLSDNELDDPFAAIRPSAASQKPTAISAKKSSVAAASQQPKLPSKPLPPAEAVRESRNLQNGGRGRGGGARANYRNYGERDARSEVGNTEGRNAPPSNQGLKNEAAYSNFDDFQGVKSGKYRGGNPYGRNGGRSGDNGGLRDFGQGGFRGLGRAGRGEGEWSRRRESDRQPDFERSNEIKSPGINNASIRTETAKDQLGSVEKEDKKASFVAEEQRKIESPDDATDDKAEKSIKSEEDNEMTLDEYERLLGERRKALAALRTEERKVNVDKAFNSMQLVDKKSEDDVFIKLGSEKEKIKKKEILEKEEKARKSVSIDEFLKPTDGESGSSGFRTRGRGRGNRGGNRGSFAVSFSSEAEVPVPRIEDPGQFPTLGGK